ncbi:MAG: hypothetical protein AAGI52_11200 [Bacteroidota bacterium]
MRRALFVFLATILAVPTALAQSVETGYGVVQALPLGARNGVTTLDAAGGRLYAGPRLVVVEPDGQLRYLGDNAAFTPPTPDDARAFSIAASAGGTVVVGLGYTEQAGDESIPSAAGYAVSFDGGQTFAGRAASLDAPTDITVTYGTNTLPASPIFTPADAPPFWVDVDPTTGDLYSANALAGLRVSRDGGQNWSRVVLPPDTLRAIQPGEAYTFPYSPAGVQLPGATDASQVSLFGFNFVVYSVLVDEEGTVWAGSLAGLNRGDADGIDAATGDRAWVRYTADAARPSPAADFIVALKEREIDGARDEVWMAAWPSGRSEDLAPNTVDEQFGVTVWRGDDPDTGAPLFDTVLLGERVYDLAFSGPSVYAAGQNGLFISENGGRVWRTVRVFRGADGQPLPLRPGSSVFSVAVTADGTLWAGTGDGLLASTDGGDSWTLYRASVPTTPDLGDRSDEVTEVEAYAYPNPFSPRSDRLTRIRVDLDAASPVRVRIFDFGMRLVAELGEEDRGAGPNEVLWRGVADNGTRVANGAYIYIVDAGDRQFSGKILVLD